jgi:hypothetical protein
MRALVSILFLIAPLLAQSPWNIVTINVPGALETEVRGVNNYGEIVGFYRPSTSVCLSEVATNRQVPTCGTRGFKIINGVLTKLNVPGATSTAIMGVNDYGDLVGFYLKPQAGCPSGIYHGFVWYHQNVIKTLDFPNATGFCGSDAGWTVPMGISRGGTVAGAIWYAFNGQPSGGFVWSNGAYHHMNIGWSGGCTSCNGVYGVSGMGKLVGTTWYILDQIPLWTGFFKEGADEDFFQLTQDDTFTTAVNDKTDIAGYGVYGNGFFAKHIELNEGTNDTNEVQPYFISLMAGSSTYPFGMNDQRVVVGAYYDEDGIVHGFVATPKF